MSEVVQIPRSEWENMKHKIDFLVKAIQPLAKGYKPPKRMSADDVMDYLSIGPDRLKQLRASGQIRYYKCGKQIEYERKDIEDYKMGNIIISKKQVA